MNKKCVILAGGPLEDCDKVKFQLEKQDYCIACDAGYQLADYFHIVPDLMVGDFDSYRGKIDPRVETYTVPAEKNDTDTMLGLKIGLEKGYRKFLIVGGFGGRLDHTVANLQSLVFLADKGASGEIRSNRNWATAIKEDTLALPRAENSYISVFAGDGVCTGVNLHGMKYPLEEYTLTPQFPLGISNEFLEETARISVRKGTLLVIISRKEGAVDKPAQAGV
ncbi:thiamine diphosphokinase [Youxingia wuxianensis]|uniref:Thiamine diphosphokinase n=1 Tax=Youxingia wuxianensis TaxID=2763678 RepID=A0A926ESB5_9FIRM|nr:thiamine diphosphokinase [Youxingia wuxianensis]MBC8585712.1 thiamine diphosphokinase [Youxingia wuxianensis]